MKYQKQINQLVSQQASEWIETLKTGGERERAAFVAWLKESRRHAGEFLSMVAVDRELDGLDAERRQDIHALLAKVQRVEENVVHLGPAARPARAKSSWRVPVAVAATILISILAVMLFRTGFLGTQSYSTAIGQQRRVDLADGSIVHLNTQSDINVRLGSESREIRLTHGEAMFKVAPDPSRPFWVRTPTAYVQAIGTEFNVYVQPHGTTVSVVEGKVQVTRAGDVFKHVIVPAVGPGDEVRVTDLGEVSRERVANAEKLLAWRQRRLVFREDTLEDMVAEFNRYNEAPRFRLAGERIRGRHYSGTFSTDDPGSLADLLSREQGLVVEKGEEWIVVRER